MIVLLNFLLAIVAGGLTAYGLAEVKIPRWLKAVIVLTVGLIVFLLNLAKYVVTNGQGV